MFATVIFTKRVLFVEAERLGTRVITIKKLYGIPYGFSFEKKAFTWEHTKLCLLSTNTKALSKCAVKNYLPEYIVLETLENVEKGVPTWER